MLRTLLASLACLALLSGCTTVLIPPSAPTDPVSVFVLDHGQHSSLLLPTEAGGAVRYSYGDWAYYVEDRKSVFNGFRALLWPTRAALGRQDIAATPDVGALSRQIGLVVIDAHEIQVERTDVLQLHLKLTRMFTDSPHEPMPATSNPSHFVEHPVRYSLAHNSNHVVGQWLTELGCDVIGRPLLSTWRVMPPVVD